MNKTKQIFRQWLPLALMPMMSVAVLNGCSSDNDGSATTTPVVAVDADNNGIPDAFEAATTGGTDANADGIDDIYATTETGTDSNTNGIDDSYEASLTGGADTNADGIDDVAAATLAGGTTPTDTIDADGNGVPDAFEVTTTGGTDANGDNIDDIYATTETGTDSNENGVDDSFEASLTGGADANMDGIDDAAAAALAGTGGETGGGETGGETGGGTDTTGSLGEILLGLRTDQARDKGSVDFSWDGSALSGSVTVVESVGATEAWLYQGIAASRDEGSSLLQLSGASPNFTFPIGLSSDQTAPITTAMASGNLYIVVESASGQIRSDQLLPPGGAVVATYTALNTNDSSVTSNGDAFMNINKNTGDFTAYLNVILKPEDTDNNGDPVSLSAAHIHQDSASGTVMVTLDDTGSSVAFSKTGQLNTEQLAIINNNNGWFNVHQNDGTSPGPSFLSGQIKLP